MEVKVNGKTLSISHYLDKRLKPTIIDGVKLFPVYAQVNYNYKNTRFKSFTDLTQKEYEEFLLSEEQEDKLVNGSLPPKLKKADEQILKIVEYEIDKYNERFTLKALGSRLNIYGYNVGKIFDDYIYSLIKEVLSETTPYNKYVQIIEQSNNSKALISNIQTILKFDVSNLLKNIRTESISKSEILPLMDLSAFGIIAATPDYLEIIRSEGTISCFDWLMKKENHKQLVTNLLNMLPDKDGGDLKSGINTFALELMIDRAIEKTIEKFLK